MTTPALVVGLLVASVGVFSVVLIALAVSMRKNWDTLAERTPSAAPSPSAPSPSAPPADPASREASPQSPQP